MTSECRIYKAHPSHKLLPDEEQLYVMDTPGLNSNDAASLIVERIDQGILDEGSLNKVYYEIVGVAYVHILSSERDVTEKGESPLRELIDLLKVKM